MSVYTPEASAALNFLCSMPTGHTTLYEDDLKILLLNSGGDVMAQGQFYNIASSHLGAGVYRVSLELRNP